jgi:cytochrome c-type biogenesis protein CcmH/NrfG
MKIKHVLLVVAMTALASLTAAAQTGRLEGDVVKADTKEPIVGAEIQIERTDIKGSYPVKTDKKGHFLHAGVPYVGTYVVMASAPGCQPDYVEVKGSHTEAIKFELRPGDGKKLTAAEVKALKSSAPKGGPQMNAADQKKAMEEYEKKRAEVESKNKKMMEEHEAMKKRFDTGQQLMAAKDWNGAANEFSEAAKLDAEQQAVWQGLALALYNRGVTNFNDYTKDVANNGAKKDAAKQDFNDSINAIGKAIAIVEPQLNDPQKGAQMKKSKSAFLKTKADAEYLLAAKLGVVEMADAGVKDYKEASALSDNPAEKASYEMKAAQTLYDSNKMDEAIGAYNALLEADANNIEALYWLGLAFVAKEKYQDAANTLQKFIDMAPATDSRVADTKAVIKDLVVGNNLQPPKSEPSRGRTPARKKP